MSKITEHFSTEEMYCKCHRCKGKTPPPKIVANLKLTAQALEKLRAKIGKPISVNCAYRCPAHNAELTGAAKGSFHMQGLAADIHVAGLSTKELFKIASGLNPEQIPAAPKNKFGFTGCGYYPEPRNQFVHVDVAKGSPRPNSWHV